MIILLELSNIHDGIMPEKFHEFNTNTALGMKQTKVTNLF